MNRPQPDPIAPGQESVWDYPRPPRAEALTRRIMVTLGGAIIVDTDDVVRVLETSHPPVYYLPIADFAAGSLTEASGSSFCEFKGAARYFDVHGGDQTRARSAWNYPHPTQGFEMLTHRVAIYPAQMEICTIDGVPVGAQPGSFYGGWVTPEIVGPFKGAPGSMAW